MTPRCYFWNSSVQSSPKGHTRIDSPSVLHLQACNARPAKYDFSVGNDFAIDQVFIGVLKHTTIAETSRARLFRFSIFDEPALQPPYIVSNDVGADNVRGFPGNNDDGGVTAAGKMLAVYDSMTRCTM